MEKPFRPLAGTLNWPVSDLGLVGLSCIGNSDASRRVSPLTPALSPLRGEGEEACALTPAVSPLPRKLSGFRGEGGGAPGTARPTSEFGLAGTLALPGGGEGG